MTTILQRSRRCVRKVRHGVLRCVDFLKDPVTDHVPDPYYTGDFETVLDMLEEPAAGLELAMKQAETG